MRIELRAELTHRPLTLQALGALDDFFLRHVDDLTQDCERRGDERNLALQSSQQLPVPLINILHLGSPQHANLSESDE